LGPFSLSAHEPFLRLIPPFRSAAAARERGGFNRAISTTVSPSEELLDRERRSGQGLHCCHFVYFEEYHSPDLFFSFGRLLLLQQQTEKYHKGGFAEMAVGI
jgi:hypothetical protein